MTMALQQKLRSSAIKATAAVAFIEVTTHLPSEGRSSLTYHHLFDNVITPLGRRLFDPEGAHHLALEVVRRGLAPRLSREGEDVGGRVNMKVEIGSNKEGKRKLQFPGPIGLAAGFDKNGTSIPGLFDLGFSFVEIGSVTPLPQPGNPKPRSFRLVEDRGVINRFGFNSEGVENVSGYLNDYRVQFGGKGSDHCVWKQPERVISDSDSGYKETNGDNSFLWALGWVWNKVMMSKPRTGILGVNLGKNKTSDDEVGVSYCSIFIFLTLAFCCMHL